jgi:hypothetical protein
MNIPILGSLEAEPDIPEWLTSDPRGIPFFDGIKLPIVLDSLDEADEKEVESAIVAFLLLGPIDRLEASQHVFENYKRMAAMTTEEDLDCQIESPEAVWQHVRPAQVFVARRNRRDCAIYVTIAAECDWEREHGLQIVYRRGQYLTRVSDQDGHLTHADAYDLPEDQDRIVS